MYVEYPIRLAWACLVDRQPRILVVTTNTFYAPLVAAFFSRRHQPVIHLVWDLFPDALLVGSERRTLGWLTPIIEFTVKQTLSRVSANVFLGERLLEHARSRFRDVPNAHVIPAGANARMFATCPPAAVAPDDPVDILYCGNLGAMHDTETLVRALAFALRHRGTLSGITLTFHASGSQYPALREQLHEVELAIPGSLRFEAPLDDSAWARRMTRAHVALVTMKPGSENVVMPSKTYSALAAGQAVIAICPYDSDLARLIRHEGCGWVVSPGAANELLEVFRQVSCNRGQLMTKRANAYRAGQSTYSDAAVARKWVELIKMT